MNTEIVQKEETPIAEIPQSTGLSPLVQAAMSGQLDTDKLAQLLEIQKQYEANEAEKAFHKALSAFKANAIELEKDKKVSFEMTGGGEKSYRHTTLGHAMKVVSPLLSQNGLSVSWETSQDMQNGGMITVTCVLAHSMGHSKKTSLSASPDASGKKNSIQAIGSTVSYLERYTAFSLLGLASMDQDDDGGERKEVPTITPGQADEIHARIKEHQITDGFMKWLAGPPLKCGSIEEIRADQFQMVSKRIDSAIRSQEKS